MSDGTGVNNPCINRTLSCGYDGNVQGFPKDLNRSKQKGLPYRVDLIKNKSPYIGGFMYYNLTSTLYFILCVSSNPMCLFSHICHFGQN